MSLIKRLHPSLLYHGAAIDLNDLVDGYSDVYKTRFFQHDYWSFPRPNTIVHVDYLLQTDVCSYAVVPMSNMSLREVQEAGLLLDTGWIERTIPRKDKYTRRIMRVVDTQMTVRKAPLMRGEQLMSKYRHHDGAALRAKHRYLPLNQLAAYVFSQVYAPTGSGCRVDFSALTQVLQGSATLHQWCQNLFLVNTADYQGDVLEAWVRVDAPRMRRWIKRNRSKFLNSATLYQAMVDDMQGSEIVNNDEEILEQVMRKEEEAYYLRSADYADSVAQLEPQEMLELAQEQEIDVRDMLADLDVDIPEDLENLDDESNS